MSLLSWTSAAGVWSRGKSSMSDLSLSRQQTIIESLPAHLKGFVKVQDYAAYTPRDQAVWRFLLRQLQAHLAGTAHPVYLEGLRRTGISADYIPILDEMNACLEKIGWEVLGVDGFIPPAIFMEFQARRILVIATDMRTIDQILYTPAPDIVHESAGHAPFLIDVDYAEFLQRFGEIGMKVLSRREDQLIYAAIRHLSISKKDSTATAMEIQQAEASLESALQANQYPSEATLLARLYWWTVEYGLVGTLQNYKIYGAGLLSSLAESRHCLDDSRVAKRLLTLAAITQPYDITREQPQLYVTHSCRHLCQVLEDMARGLAQQTGGLGAIEEAINCETVATVEYNSGLQVSGQVTQVHSDAMGNVSYVQTTGPTQLSFAGQQLPDQGIERHAAGYGSPVGYVTGFKRCLSDYSMDELQFVGIEVGRSVSLEFVSGFQLQGELIHIVRRRQKNVLLSFIECRVLSASGDVLFDPAWGQFDMAVGVHIDSVFGGAADPARYCHQASWLPSDMAAQEPAYDLEPSRLRPAAATELALFECYAGLRQCREAPQTPEASVWQLVELIIDRHPGEWLLLFEAIELLFLRNRRFDRSGVGSDCPAARLISTLRNNLPSEPGLEKVLIEALRRMEINIELG